MRNVIRIVCLLTIAAGGASPGCSSEASVTEAGHADEAHGETAGPTNTVDIPPTVRRNLGITFAKVQRRQVANTIRVPGAFELIPGARREYRLVLPGQVELLVEQFDRVTPGTPLYRFRSPEWPELRQEIVQAEQGIALAEGKIAASVAALNEARVKLQAVDRRVGALRAANFRRADLEAELAARQAAVPTLEAYVEMARTDLATAKRTLAHALRRASISVCMDARDLDQPVEHDGQYLRRCHTIDWIEVRAGESGIVEKLALTDGTYAEATALVLSVIGIEKIRFRAMALQADLARFTDGQSARIVPPRSPGCDAGECVEAKMTVGLEADPGRRTVALLATPLAIRPWTRPGVSAFLEVVTDSTEAPVVAIPRSAVVRDGTVHVFFRRDPQDPNKAIRVEADLGVDNGQWVEIKSGLMLGDEVVLEGAYELKLATSRSGATHKAGHFHGDGSFHGEH